MSAAPTVCAGSHDCGSGRACTDLLRTHHAARHRPLLRLPGIKAFPPCTDLPSLGLLRMSCQAVSSRLCKMLPLVACPAGFLHCAKQADVAVLPDQAEIHLGNFFEGSIAAMKSKGHNLKSQMHAAGLALKVPFHCLRASLLASIAAARCILPLGSLLRSFNH